MNGLCCYAIHSKGFLRELLSKMSDDVPAEPDHFFTGVFLVLSRREEVFGGEE